MLGQELGRVVRHDMTWDALGSQNLWALCLICCSKEILGGGRPENPCLEAVDRGVGVLYKRAQKDFSLLRWIVSLQVQKLTNTKTTMQLSFQYSDTLLEAQIPNSTHTPKASTNETSPSFRHVVQPPIRPLSSIRGSLKLSSSV